jgi:hypothetical protein
VLPQITAQIASVGIADPSLRDLYNQIYTAFRRRRSLLLLNLEHQVQLDELPWVSELGPLRADDMDTRTQARQTLGQVTLLALTSFPQTILPNPLVGEMGALATRAGLDLPLVEELAADIFMGTFTTKWDRAARETADLFKDTFYARYYDLPEPAIEPEARGLLAEFLRLWRGPPPSKVVADAFAALCKARAKEAKAGGKGRVAANGAVLEQSQILTTHNLAVLVSSLELNDRLRPLTAALAAKNFAWIVRRQTQKSRATSRPFMSAIPGANV